MINSGCAELEWCSFWLLSEEEVDVRFLPVF
jgi:hypothetical protein